MKKKNGFTLVELLAVIVILAIVMLIGGTTVLPMMQKAQKNSLGEEGLSMLDAAEKTFTTEAMVADSAPYKLTDSVCYSLKYLCEKGAFDKGCEDGNDNYTGSVLVNPKSDGTYEFTFWVSNGTYVFNAADKNTYANIDDASILYSGGVASEDCGSTIPADVTPEVKEHTKTVYQQMEPTRSVYIYIDPIPETSTSQEPNTITTPANVVNTYNTGVNPTPRQNPILDPDPYPSQNPGGGVLERPTPEEPTPTPEEPKPYPSQPRPYPN